MTHRVTKLYVRDLSVAPQPIRKVSRLSCGEADLEEADIGGHRVGGRSLRDTTPRLILRYSGSVCSKVLRGLKRLPPNSNFNVQLNALSLQAQIPS